MTSARSLMAARAVTAAAFLDLFMQFPTMAPYAVALGAPAAVVGLIVAAYSATNLIGNLIGGAVLDRWGRRRPLLVGLGVTAGAVVAYAFASSPGALLAVRAVHGLAASVLPVGSFAIMGDAAAPGRRAWVMGQGGALIGAAAIVGPLAAGVLRDRAGFDAVFFTLAALMALAFIAAWRWVREDRSRGPAQSRGISLRLILSRRPLWAAYAAVVAYTIGLGVVVTHLAIILQAAGYPAAVTGMVFGAFALVAVAVMLSPFTRASDARGRRSPLGIGLALVAGGLLVMSSGGSAAVAGMAVFGFGFGLVFPSAAAVVVESVMPGERGMAFGVFYALWSLGTVAGAGLAGGMAQWQGAVTGAAFMVAALFSLLGLPAVLALLSPRSLPREPVG